MQALLAPCIRLPILESSYANPFQWHIEQISSYSKRNAESEMMSRNAEGEMMSRNVVQRFHINDKQWLFLFLLQLKRSQKQRMRSKFRFYPEKIFKCIIDYACKLIMYYLIIPKKLM